MSEDFKRYIASVSNRGTRTRRRVEYVKGFAHSPHVERRRRTCRVAEVRRQHRKPDEPAGVYFDRPHCGLDRLEKQEKIPLEGRRAFDIELVRKE
jgi:hypothetical protein